MSRSDREQMEMTQPAAEAPPAAGSGPVASGAASSDVTFRLRVTPVAPGPEAQPISVTSPERQRRTIAPSLTSGSNVSSSSSTGVCPHNGQGPAGKPEMVIIVAMRRVNRDDKCQH